MSTLLGLSGAPWFYIVLVFPGKVAIMSRTVAFGMDALGSGEDLEELLAALTGDEVTVEM